MKKMDFKVVDKESRITFCGNLYYKFNVYVVIRQQGSLFYMTLLLSQMNV